MNAIVDNHEAPMVLSSIMKQNVTDRGRDMVNAGMDVLGGAGISMGDSNYIGGAYMSFPIAITRAGKGCEIPNFKGSYLGRFPLVLADFWTSDHLSERSRSVNVVSGTRARGTAKLKRR